MKRNLALLLIALSLWAAPALAADDAAKDAVLGISGPAPMAWRVPTLRAAAPPGARPPLLHSAASASLLA
ncbi:MAG: hypothetical protein AAB262_14155, partial [Elusimicrobiota bacterium]